MIVPFAAGGATDTIGRVVSERMADGAVQSRFIELGFEFSGGSALMKTEAEKWWPIIKEFGIKAE
jgi:hypothetical protein